MLKLLITIGIAVIPFTIAYHLNSQSNETISLDQFTAYNILGRGSFGRIYVAKKNGGADDGTLYALKAIDVSHAIAYAGPAIIDALNGEREFLEAVRGLPYATALHYAFRKGKWLFFVMDLVTGGNVFDRLRDEKPEPNTAKLILAETIDIVEKLHNHHILHGDLSFKNILINNDGHFVFTDFGYSNWRTDNNASNRDWSRLSFICYQVFPDNDKSHKSLKNTLKNVTDNDLPELKNHPFFDGIDWASVAESKSTPSYQPNALEIDYNDPLDLELTLEISDDDDLDADLVEKFQNFTFVAPEHRY